MNEQALRFAFKDNNNQAKYKALIAEILLAKEMSAKSLLAKSDSLLGTGHVTGGYQAKDPQMVIYLEYVRVLKKSFMVFELVHIPKEKNARADLLAKLAISGTGGRQRTVIQEILRTPRTFAADNSVELYNISTSEGMKRSHRSLTQETLKMPRISTYPVSGEEALQVCLI